MLRIMGRKLVKPINKKSTFFPSVLFKNEGKHLLMVHVKFQLDLHEVSLDVWRQLLFVAKDKNDV